MSLDVLTPGLSPGPAAGRAVKTVCERRLDETTSDSKTHFRRPGIIAAVVLLLSVGGAWALRKGADQVRYATVTVDRGDVVGTVSATGTLQAVVTVQVGSQVSGIIQELGADFNSTVKSGQVIAQLDPSSFEARVTQERANRASAVANVEGTRVAIEDASQRYERAQKLASEGLVAPADLETAHSTLEGARARFAAAQAAVTQAEAALQQAEFDLQHTVIRTPISGVVLARNVDVGQTVAASLQAPVLFVIANDLSRMQVNALVDEADVGTVRADQAVVFNVDAHPERTFSGNVQQVRLQPTTTQNVVSYSVIISVDNAKQFLMPGMTASVQIKVARQEQALRLPVSVLRFRPPDKLERGSWRTRRSEVGASNELTGDPAGREALGGGEHTTLVYAVEGKELAPRLIVTGISDGQYVEVRQGLKEGDVVVAGVDGIERPASSASASSGSNPFSPQLRRHTR